ncbi:MAG: NfeD family protein [Candidatus Gastranaerophilales bacterium]
MDAWQIFGIVGLVCLILEMFTPSLFFLNLALAGFLTAFVSLLPIDSYTVLAVIFVAFSVIMLLFVRPLLVRNKETETGVSVKYINKEVKVIEPITKSSGAISIYDERWEARCENDGEIPVDSIVKILRNDSLVMFVEKV